MKMRREVLKLLILLCSVFTTTVGLGQTTYTWTGAGDGTNLATPGNWTTNGSTPAVTLPNGTYLDTAQWDGVTTTNLIITYGTVSLPGTGFGTFGINLVLTANQTNSVQIISAATPSAAIGLFGINIASGAGAFTLGNNTPNNLLLMGRPAGAVHHFVNNSTNPVTLNPSIEWEAGGGNGYTYDFGGTGNWIVNTYLMPLDGAFSVSPIMVDGPGTVFWSAGKTGVYNPNAPLGPVTINGGALVIKSAGLFTGTANQAITNNAIFVFDAASQSQTLNGIISGPGQLIVSNGTLMLAGTNTYTGNIFLSGGELIVASAENPGTSGPLGVTNTISSNGGTLGFSVNNTFDYSSRFSAPPRSLRRTPPPSAGGSGNSYVLAPAAARAPAPHRCRSSATSRRSVDRSASPPACRRSGTRRAATAPGRGAIHRTLR